jgi:hypothetical protein
MQLNNFPPCSLCNHAMWPRICYPLALFLRTCGASISCTHLSITMRNPCSALPHGWWDPLSRPPLLLLLVQQRTSCRVLGSRQSFYPLVFNGHLLLIYLLFTAICDIPYPPSFNKNSGRRTVQEECHDMYAVALLWRFSLLASAPLKTSIITASLNCSVLEKVYILKPFNGMLERLLVR